MAPKAACGPHVELASNDAARVTRCTCGTVHLTLHASGVTVRLGADALKGASSALRHALERMEDKPPQISSTGSTSIN